jgi:hypothetical protein
MSVKKCPTEYEEQVALVNWLEAKGYLFSKVAQDTWTPSWGQKHRNRRSGLRKGVPDLMIVLPNRLLCFIELKRKTNYKIDDEQLKWIAALNQIPSVRAAICKGMDDAVYFISTLL